MRGDYSQVGSLAHLLAAELICPFVAAAVSFCESRTSISKLPS